MCDLELPLSISSILSAALGHPGDTYVCFLVYPSILSFPLSFNKVLYKPVSTQDVTNSVSPPSLIYLGYSSPTCLYEIFHTNFSTDIILYPAPHLKILHVFLVYFLQCRSFSLTQCRHLAVSSLNSSPIC